MVKISNDSSKSKYFEKYVGLKPKMYSFFVNVNSAS